jgi:hypothetical protein
MIKWYYFYTKDYEYWNKHLYSSLNGNYEIFPIQTDNLNIKENIGQHHFDGIVVKIELIIDAIKNNIGKKIYFSDCTLFFNQNNLQNKYLQNLAENSFNDLTFADNGDNTYNICLILINCNSSTLDFFIDVKNIISNKIITWDQKAVNYLLSTEKFKTLKIGKFDNELIVCSSTLPKKIKNKFIAYKQFISSINKILNWNFRLKYLYLNQLINKSDYDNNILDYDINKYPYTDYMIFLLKNEYENYLFILLIIIFLIILVIKQTI